VTPVSATPTDVANWDAVIDDALNSAHAAAAASDVEIREVHEPLELDAISRLLSLIWNRQIDSRPVTSELLRALTMTGHYVTGGFIEGELVGAAVAFFAAPPESTLHSHITGVVSQHAARSVGYALKLHQRAWALQRGVSTMTWTFDPLVRRNAYFNLAKLGVRAVEYLPNFYGAMQDPINAGDDSDRLLVVWDLAAPQLEPDPAPGAPVVLQVGADGAPLRRGSDAPETIVEIPAEIETMRVREPALARAWRLAVRDCLGEAMAGGAVVRGFRRGQGYVVAAPVDGTGSRP
jgi:predicted GNAT superfamily acetyltransferase